MSFLLRLRLFVVFVLVWFCLVVVVFSGSCSHGRLGNVQTLNLQTTKQFFFILIIVSRAGVLVR